MTFKIRKLSWLRRDDVKWAVTLVVSALAVWVAVLGPLARIQKDVALQNYRNNIQVQWEYPRLERVNSWSDANICAFLQTPTFWDKGQPVYQAQFIVVNAPNNFKIETYIVKREVSPGEPNTFPESTRPVVLQGPGKRVAFGNDENKPRIFKADMVLVDRNPTTIIVNIMKPGGEIVKSEFYDIVGSNSDACRKSRSTQSTAITGSITIFNLMVI